ncbi:MAG TPA: septum formation initiator family protein [Acidimicrobiales bacterium]|nr:septum formation initiator family protein [Acidimicrobiales bacterium]
MAPPSVPRFSILRPSTARRSHQRPRPVQRRRARALLLAAVVFAAVVLLSALPWSTLADQHAQLTSASSELSQLQAENRALAVQARRLSNKTTQAGLARQDYGLVESGQKAFDILPPPGTTPSEVTGGGHVPLDEPPVVPGSRRSEELLGVDVGSSAPLGDTVRSTSAQVASDSRPARQRASVDPLGARGFWSRVAHTLEFWS